MRLFSILAGFGLLLAACGDDGGGSDADAAVEVVDAAPVTGACGVHTNAALIPVEGELAIFSRPDGSFLGNATFDANGDASRDDCIEDTVITLTYSSNPTSRQLVTLHGVDPGVTARWLDIEAAMPSPSVVVTTNATSPPAATTFRVLEGCRLDDPPGELVGTLGVATPAIEVNFLCAGRTPGDADILAVGLDAGELPLGFSFVKDVPLAGPDTPVDMSAAAWSVGVTDTVVTVNGYSDSLGAAALTRIEQLVDGASYWEQVDVVTPGSPASFTVTTPTLPSGFLEQFVLGGVIGHAGGGISSQFHYVEPTATLEMDLSTLLPRVTNALVSKADPQRPVLQWLADGDVSGTQGTMLVTSWNDAGINYNWVAVVPSSAGLSYQLPELPDLASDYRPTETAVYGQGLVVVFDQDWRGYDDVLTDGTVIPTLVLVLGRFSITRPTGDATTQLSISRTLPAAPPI